MDHTEFIRIRINALIPEKETTFALYVLINNRHVLYLRPGQTLTKEKIAQLSSSKNDVFYIKIEDRQEFKNYIHQQMEDNNLSSANKALLLKESSYALVEELFEKPDINEALEESKEVIANFVSFIDQEDDAIGNLIGLSSHDFYTYNHSLDVSIYSIGLGAVAGYSDDDLKELGRGALFHDIGKRHVDPAIICKNGPLDDAEWAQMQKHPVYGLKLLNDFENISEAIKACAFEHHENFMGNGYPQGLDGEDIHPMARIIAITDCYDAMTTKRSYNEPMAPLTALEFMHKKLKGKFDPDLLKAMHSVMFQMEEAEKNNS